MGTPVQHPPCRTGLTLAGTGFSLSSESGNPPVGFSVKAVGLEAPLSLGLPKQLGSETPPFPMCRGPLRVPPMALLSPIQLLPVDLGSYVSPYGVPPTPALWAAQVREGSWGHGGLCPVPPPV